MAKTFTTETWVHFHEADPAGILFFGRIFEHAHMAFERFIVAAGMPWDDYFHTSKYLIPLRHVEGDYLRPFFPGKKYQVEVHIQSIGASSFVVAYAFTSEHEGHKALHATVKTVHAVLDRSSHTKIPIPLEFVEIFKPYLHSENHS